MNQSRTLLALAFTGTLLFAACTDKSDTNTQTTDTAAAHRSAGIDTVGLPRFDGANALKQAAAQVAFGPRNPNSEGAAKTRDYLVAEMSKYADAVSQQTFTQSGYGDEQLHLTNIIASFNKNARQRIMICAHWDTRPRADQDPDTSKRSQPILGANDAASGVGVLLELARVMKQQPPGIGVDLVLFDGEDYGAESDLANYFLGSRYFAKNLPAGFQPAFAVLLDMVGDQNASFPKEAYSVQYAPTVVDILWNGARALSLPNFSQVAGPGIQDDHLPLNEAGIKTIDIIDANLVGNNTNDPRREYWHTTQDTMDKVSAGTLASVGRLLVLTIYKLVPASTPA
jgi:Zn-dependent M28 family amino/carboxypeptidase